MTNWAGMAQNYQSQAATTTANMDKRTFSPPPPRKTMGGALSAGLGMGMAGAEAAESGWLGSTIGLMGQGGKAATDAAPMVAGSAAGPVGAGIGAGVGMLAYFLS